MKCFTLDEIVNIYSKKGHYASLFDLADSREKAGIDTKNKKEDRIYYNSDQIKKIIKEYNKKTKIKLPYYVLENEFS